MTSSSAMSNSSNRSWAWTSNSTSPALAKRLRRELQRLVGPDYQLVAEIMGLVRPLVLQRGLSQAANEPIFQGLVDGDILGLVARRDWPELEAYLEAGLQQKLPLDVALSVKKLLSR